jgi:hypothetical protein
MSGNRKFREHGRQLHGSNFTSMTSRSRTCARATLLGEEDLVHELGREGHAKLDGHECDASLDPFVCRVEGIHLFAVWE